MRTSGEELTPVSIGSEWPSGGYVELALLDVSADYLQSFLGISLAAGEEIGLGSWRAIGFRLRSGALVELIAYEHQVPVRFILRVEAQRSSAAVLEELVATLKLADESVIWKSPSVEPISTITPRRR